MEGGIGYMFLALFLGGLVVVAWLFLWAVYGLIMLARPSRPIKMALAAVFLALSAIPCIIARQTFYDSLEEDARREASGEPGSGPGGTWY